MLLLSSLAFGICLLWPTCAALAEQHIVFGNEILRDNDYAELTGFRTAVLTNPTGLFMDNLVHIVDAMVADERVDIVAVFSPEHGFRGDHQAETGDPLFYVDKQTGLPVFSAYNMTSSQIADVLVSMNIGAVLVDMQDVGVRLYTFIWTMYDVMDAIRIVGTARSSASSGDKGDNSRTQRNIKVVVADRPNPLGGLMVDGPLLNVSCCSSGYGKLPLTHVHGMTIGELALFFNSYLGIDAADVVVVQMQGWSRSMTWNSVSENGQRFPPWVPPSPNLPTSASTQAYGATVFLEATTAAEGRGTTTPFTLFGAPFIDAEVRLVASSDLCCLEMA